MLDVRVCGGVEVEVDGRVLPEALIGGRQGRLVLAYLVCERTRAVRREELADLLWPELLPDSWAASLSAVISRLRRMFAEAGLDGQAVIASVPGAYQLFLPADSRVDLEGVETAVARAEDLATADIASALAAAAEAEAVAARGFLADDCAWVDRRRDMLRDLRVRAAIAASVAHVAGGAATRAIDAARRAVELDPTKEAAYRQLMQSLAAAGERGEALRVWERCRITLVDELGIDPSPETEAVYLQLLDAAPPAATTTQLPSGVVTFLLTDIVESSAMWEERPAAMAVAIERHDAIVGDVVAAHGGTLLKSKLEGDATVSVFARATGAASAALACLDAFAAEEWPDGAQPRLRMAMHTGEAFERGGDYFGPALNRAARLRSLAGPDEVLLSQAVTELVQDHLPSDAVLRDRGHHNLRGLSRGENVFQLVRTTVEDTRPEARREASALARPPVPAVLAGAGPFVGRKDELGELVSLWDACVAGRSRAALIGGEPGVGKSRLAGEIAQHSYGTGALVVYGRCDEDLGAPLQPFIEAVSVLAPALGADRLREIRGIDELTRVAPSIAELLPEAAPSVRADPDSERLALFDAVVQVLLVASCEAPVLLVVDDLHWAGKTTLSLLRHVLRGVKDHRVFVVGTYRDTELARTHPLAATLADLRRDAETFRMSLSGLAATDVEAYLAAIGNTDRALGREVAEVTAGNPFFLIEVVRHVEESGGVWQPGTLPEGVREATGRRLSRLSDAANDALAVAAVVGPAFDLALVEQVQGTELVDPIAEACQAGLVVEENALGRFRFAHALVRQVLLSELVSLKRVRLHRTIAELLEAAPLAGDADARLADLAYHWFECASTGSADRAVVACRRAADRALDRVAYEEAGDLYGMALHALEWIETPDTATRAELHLARCDALLTAGDVAGARSAIDELEDAAAGSEQLTAWYTTYEGLLVVLSEPDRLTEIVRSIGAAAGAMRAVGDLTGEAKAHYVHASALERLGQIGPAERALDAALAAARSANDRRLADSILAEAPPAALWGPSSVTRASGKCLDVVRVLRITSANPAIEAVALRCQAVLEALRGRMDASRRMIGSARRTVERLGLTHRRLETEVAAGYIELLDGDAAAAEQHLRTAYEDLRERGLGGEAAQAGAFLGRALLMQDRVDEADEVASEAETLAGSDLKAGIAWRGVRAEAAARRGDIDRALALAREAVELATATDALLLIVDARFALAAVLRAAGEHAAADAEARRAADDCDEKGATVLSARVRPLVPANDGPAIAVRERSPFENDATRTLARIHAAFNAHDWDALMANYSADYLQADARPILGRELDADQSLAGLRVVFDGRGHFEDENIATRGRSLALTRTTLRIPDPEAIGVVLIATEVDAEGKFLRSTIFDTDDVDNAIAALDEMYRAGEGAPHADVLRLADSLIGALLAHDTEAIRPLLAPDCVVADDRRVGFPMQTVDDWLAGVGATLDLWGEGDIRVEHVLDVGPDGGLWACVSSGAELATGGRYEVPWLMALGVADGLIRSHSLHDPSDVDVARRSIRSAPPVGNTAWRGDQRMHDACMRRDWQAFVEAVTPELAYIDHRLRVRHDGEAARDVFRTFFALGHFDWQKTLLATRGDTLAMCRNEITLVDGVAGPSEVQTITVDESDASGRITSITTFEVDDLDAAHAALDARYVELTGSARAEQFENIAWRALQKMIRACDHRDWAEFLDAVVPDLVYLDHALQVRHVGDEALDVFRTLFTTEQLGRETTLLATRGDTLVLCRNRMSFIGGVAGPAEVETVTVNECDEVGRVATITSFNVDELDAAYDALDARFAELGGPDLRPFRHAFNRQDWDQFAEFFTEDCTFADDRVGGYGDVQERDEYVALLRNMAADFAPDIALRFDHFLAYGRHGSLMVGSDIGTLDGGQFERQVASVAAVASDGRITALKVYSLENLDAARAEYARLTAPTPEERFGNLAWRTAIRFRDASNARDRDALFQVLAPGMEFDDRRWMTMDPSFESLMKIFDLEDYRIDRRLVATRGDLLALVEEDVSMRDGIAGSAEIACFTLVEIDAEGRILRHTAFAHEELAEAVDALDARYVELGGLDARAPREAFNTRDWERYASFLPEEGAMDDRRRAGYGLLSRDGFVSYEQAMLEMAPDVALRVDHVIGDTPTANLVVGAVTGTHDGGRFEMPYVALGQTTPDGRPIATVLYDLNDFEIAKAEYDRLTQVSGVDLYENAATRAAWRHAAISNAQDWDAFVAAVSPDFSFHDRRLGLALDSHGDDARANVRTSFELDELRLEHEVIATRGDSLTLVRTHTTFRDGATGSAEIVCLGIIETDAEGRQCAQLLFDADDLDGAYDELDARHAASGGNVLGAKLRQTFAARDWDAFASVLTPDCTFADYRTAGWGRVERQAFIDYQQSVIELAPDARLWITHVRSQGDVHLSTGCVEGTSAGGPWEIAYATVGVTQADGRSTLVENFELEDMTRAQARFAELVAEQSTKPTGNLASRVAEIQATSVNTGDWDAYFATLAPDAVVDDRRSGIAVVTRGDEALVSVHRTGFTLDRCHIDRELIQARGERLALFRTKVSFEDGAAGPSEVECFNTFETDEQGRMVMLIAYNLNDLDTAKAELDERFAAQAAGNDASRAVARQTANINAHNWDEFVATFAPDSVADDRRSGIALVLSGEEVFATHRVLFALDESHVDRALLATRDAHLALTRTTIRFEDGAAGPAEVEFVELFEVDELGLVTRVAAFNLDDLDTAHAELDARAIELSNGNLAWRVAQAHADHVNNGNWDALVASLTPDFEDDDRRTGVGLVTRGEQARQVYRTLFALDHCRQTRELVATSGDRLALVRSTVTFEDGDGGPAEVVSLNLFEVDEEGNVVRSVKFNVDDLAVARAELDARAASIAVE